MIFIARVIEPTSTPSCIHGSPPTLHLAGVVPPRDSSPVSCVKLNVEPNDKVNKPRDRRKRLIVRQEIAPRHG